MLNNTLEKESKEKLIFNDEIPIKTASGSPFESIEDIILSGDFKSKGKFEVEIKSNYESDVFYENEELKKNLKDNYIENAVRDLRRIPNSSFLLNNLGLAYLRNMEYEKAFDCFNQAIKIQPDFIQAILNLTFLYVAKGDYSIAVDMLKKYIEKSPTDIRLLINLGNIYFKQKKFEEAKNVFKNIIKFEPKDITSRNRLALIYLIERNFSETISELRKCLQIKNDLPAIYNNLGVAYGLLGARKKSIKSFKIALNIFPNFTSAIYNLAIALRDKNISASIELLEDYLNSKKNTRISELLAQFYFENRQYKKALKTLLEVLSQINLKENRNRDIARLNNNIGVVYHVLRDYDKSTDHYLICLKKAKYVNDIIFGNIINLHFDLNRIKEVKKYIDMYRDKFGENKYYFYYLSRYSYCEHELSDSIDYMRQFLKTNQAFSPAYAFLSYIYSEQLQDHKKAIALNEKAFRYLPKDKVTINNLAYNYLMNNEVEKAESILQKEMQVTNNVFLNATIGLLNIKKENIKEGTRFYNTAAKLARSDSLHKAVIQKKHLELARYYLEHDRLDIARDNIRKVFSTTRKKETIFTKQAGELMSKY